MEKRGGSVIVSLEGKLILLEGKKNHEKNFQNFTSSCSAYPSYQGADSCYPQLAGSAG